MTSRSMMILAALWLGQGGVALANPGPLESAPQSRMVCRVAQALAALELDASQQAMLDEASPSCEGRGQRRQHGRRGRSDGEARSHRHGGGDEGGRTARHEARAQRAATLPSSLWGAFPAGCFSARAPAPWAFATVRGPANPT